MNAAQQAQSPLAGGLSAETKTDNTTVDPAEKSGKSDLNRDPHFQDLQQRFALRGFALNVSATGSGVYVSRWGLVRFFDTLTDADAFAVQVGAL